MTKCKGKNLKLCIAAICATVAPFFYLFQTWHCIPQVDVTLKSYVATENIFRHNHDDGLATYIQNLIQNS